MRAGQSRLWGGWGRADDWRDADGMIDGIDPLGIDPAAGHRESPFKVPNMRVGDEQSLRIACLGAP